MFGSAPDVSRVRARLNALASARVSASAFTSDGVHGKPASGSGRHAVSGAQSNLSRWSLDIGGVRALLALGAAAVCGALLVVLIGWPRSTHSDNAPQSHNGHEHNVLSEPSPSLQARVVVDVDGEVRRPGVVRLPEGARVADAIREAGGATAQADVGMLNLAQVLVDGEQVVVTKRGASASGSPATTATPIPSGSAPIAAVSINTATQPELETLPGIGPVLAAAILQWRAENGAFTSIEQLQEVSGIGPATYAELAPLVRL